MRAFFLSQLLIAAVSALAVRSPAPDLADDLSVLLSPASSVSLAEDLEGLVSRSTSITIDLKARWSTFGAPLPRVVVNIGTEKDVALVVKYLAKLGVPFLAQNGGIGWSTTFNLGSYGVLINLAGLNAVTVSSDKTQTTVGGGAAIGDVIAAADAAGALIITGNCNCVGALGAVLGGAYGNLMGEVGFGVDNVLSLRVVLASGDVVTVSSTSYPDLFWALRGAGPNFGIVLSATIKSQPATALDRTAFINNLFFDPSKLVQVAQAIQDLPLLPTQRVYLVLTNSGDANNTPAVLVTGFLRKGTEADGLKAFAPIYALGPTSNSSTIADYTHWNDANIGFCSRAERKPAYSTTINNMNASAWPGIWDLYKDFQKKGPNSAVLIERYNLTKARSAPAGSAAFNQNLRTQAFAQAIVIPWYNDASLDAEALAFGQKVRSIWSFSSRPTINPTYINFAHGDEEPEALYGSSFPRLRQLKKQYDPTGAFTQWFPIKPAA